MSDKQAWEMTQEQWRPIGIEQVKKYASQQPDSWYEYQANRMHKGLVAMAIKNGDKVSQEVIADYPDLIRLVEQQKQHNDLCDALDGFAEMHKGETIVCIGKEHHISGFKL
jgi:hypothetical protein